MTAVRDLADLLEPVVRKANAGYVADSRGCGPV